MSNLKQIGLAYQMYANDCDDNLPSQFFLGTNWNAGQVLWESNTYGEFGFLAQGAGSADAPLGQGTGRYITNPAVLFCPDGNGAGSPPWNLVSFNTYFETTTTGIQVDTNYTANCDDNDSFYNAHDGPYGSGRGKLTLSARKGYACAADGFYPSIGSYNHRWNGGNGQVLGFNVLYFDGSVKWFQNSRNYLINSAPTYGDCCSVSTNTFWVLVEQH